MKRKLVKQGTATMMISLPSKWIKENKLEKGDEVDLQEKENIITINVNPVENQNVKIEKYNLSNFDPLINRALISLYVRGADEIELSFKDAEETKKLKKHVLEGLIGFEIIAQTQNKVTIKDVTGLDKQDADLLIKRVFYILDSMACEFISAVKNKGDMTPIIEIDQGINKFVHFCLRVLNKKGYSDNTKLKHIYSIVSALEEIGDSYKEIAKSVEDGQKIDKKQLESLEICKDMLKIFESLLFKFEREKAKELAIEFENIQKKIEMKNSLDFYIDNIAQRIIRMNNELFVMSFD